MANLASNAIRAIKDMVGQSTAPAGFRELLTRQFPGAQVVVDSVFTFFNRMRELSRAPGPKTDANTLDQHEFKDEVARLRKSFAVSLNPFHYAWSFIKYILGLGTKTEARVQELERFGGLATMPNGPNIYAVEACESLISILHDRQNHMQNLFSRIISPNKLAKDPVMQAAQNALKSWIPKIARLEQLEIITNRLKYGTPDFIANDIGAFAQNRVKEATTEVARMRNAPPRPAAPARGNRPEAMHKA
jgi:hypothetical protein